MPSNGSTQHEAANAGSCGAALGAQKEVILALARQLGPAGAVRLIETHISWVLLAGAVAYKFKKALRLDFLDYTTLVSRQFYCQEELRLNCRLAPDIYLAVVSITGSRDTPSIDGGGAPIEYAVKMRAFGQAALWSSRLRHDLMTGREIDQLAHCLAGFHDLAPCAVRPSQWGTSAAVARRARDDLSAIDSMLASTADRQALPPLVAWQREQLRKLTPLFARRKALGWVRECHGDLHCGNIVTIKGQVAVFDCIEFNDEMRWIDVMHDFAFVWMDLQFCGRNDWAARLLNQYLQLSGAYAGLSVLPFYRIQRALVRCKVALLRAGQVRRDSTQDEGQEALGQAAKYLAFCAKKIERGASALIITHGFSGSGKSTLCDSLVELLGAVQIRSDLERKRLHGLAMGAKAAAAPGAGIYDAKGNRAVYGRLSRLARHISGAGLPVIIDAAFLQRSQRRRFQELAHELGLPFFILDVHVNVATLRTRVAARAQLGQDASDAGLVVLEHQLQNHEALCDEELPYVIVADTEHTLDKAQLSVLLRPVTQALQSQSEPLPQDQGREI